MLHHRTEDPGLRAWHVAEREEAMARRFAHTWTDIVAISDRFMDTLSEASVEFVEQEAALGRK